MNQDEYNIKFEVNAKESTLREAAFNQVSEIRKFEIELYWKRATYFWALIAVAFAGYFSILASEHMRSKFFLSFIISCIGFVFTFAWFLSSRGSKYWQENWENHLDLLENDVTGPLYKTLLETVTHEKSIEKLITGPIRMSVSKINHCVSIFIAFVWFLLITFSSYSSLHLFELPAGKCLKIGLFVFIILITFFACVMMLYHAKTHVNERKLKVGERKTSIV